MHPLPLAVAPATARPRASLARRPRPLERLAEGLVRVTAYGAVAAVGAVLFFVLREAVPLFADAALALEVPAGSLFSPTAAADGAWQFVWQPVAEPPKLNLLPLLLGSLKVTLVALLVATPVAVMAALWVSEFAPARARQPVKIVVELLAGVPSVVVGVFALSVLASWVQKAAHTPHRLNALVAGLALSLAVAPLVFTVAEDALRAVPDSYRAAGRALGADRRHVALGIVLPAASPGIFAGIALGAARALGETMIVLLASGNAAIFDTDLGLSTRTVTATIAQELGEVTVGSAHWHVLFVLGAMLVVVSLGVNVASDAAMRHMRRKLGTGS